MPKMKSIKPNMGMPMGAGTPAPMGMAPEMDPMADTGMMDEGMSGVGMGMPSVKKMKKSSYKKPKSPAVKYPKKGSAKLMKKNTIKGFKSRRGK